jgi:hypothetical protein
MNLAFRRILCFPLLIAGKVVHGLARKRRTQNQHHPETVPAQRIVSYATNAMAQHGVEARTRACPAQPTTNAPKNQQSERTSPTREE